MTKILFITCSRIGDAVLTTSILNYINQHILNASVTIAVDPLPAPLFTHYPLLKHLIILPKQRHGRHWLSLWRQIKNQRWDWIIDLRGSAISYTLRSRRRSVWKQKKNDSRHKVEQITNLIRAPLTAPTLWFSPEQLTVAKNLLPPDTAYLAMAPAANWVGKQWPIERFIELAKRFCEDYHHAKILLIAAPHERQIVQPFIESLPKDKLTNLLDYSYDLGQIAALLSHCQLFVGNDSGLMHMSAAVGTPTIGLFGPSREENYGPYDRYLLINEKPRNTVIRIPQSYEELKNTEGFSHHSQNCYMTDLTVDYVWPLFKSHCESFL